MNIIIRGIVFTSAISLVCSCSKSPDAPASVESTPVPKQVLPLVAPNIPTQAPVSAAAALASQPTARHLAPAGVYFLTQRISITTDSGILGVDTGTKVRLVKDMGESWLVKNGDTQFEVTPDQVTNDLELANALIAKDQNSANAIAANILQQEQIDHKSRLQQYAREAELMKTDSANASVAAPFVSSLDKPAYNQHYSYPYSYYYPYYPYYPSTYQYYNH